MSSLATTDPAETSSITSSAASAVSSIAQSGQPVALTTIFTAPAYCESISFTAVPTGTFTPLIRSYATFNSYYASCFPSGAKIYGSATWSPGICPDGYTSGWTTTLSSSITQVQCCPSEFHAPGDGDDAVPGWERMCSSIYTTSTMVLLYYPGSATQLVNPGTVMMEHVLVEYEQSDLSLFPSGYTPGRVVTSDTTSEVIASPTASNPSSANTTTTSSGLSTGAKAGIGGAVGVAVILVLALLWLFFRKKWRQRQKIPMKQEIEYTGKPELDATSTRKPSQGVVELPSPTDLRKEQGGNRSAPAEHFELPGSNYPTSTKELDSVHLYEVSGSSRREPTNSSLQTSSRADSAMADSSRPPDTSAVPPRLVDMGAEWRASPPTASTVQPPVHGNLGTATTIEDLELQYLENEERRIQERKLQLLRTRESY
ncbi:hypothetical protein LTR84_006614 [Exophiala bonariae]|uniref:Uncharacterized protein n=1 Tax=Exophiala bonariae TaxID=1690606 RepID=A0AAV9N0J2_9EURO|nr:hypothetical protein LTR84_006614 [Exophiala bonariae]